MKTKAPRCSLCNRSLVAINGVEVCELCDLTGLWPVVSGDKKR